MDKRKRWKVKAADPVLQFILSRRLGVSRLMAQLLVNRGIYTAEAARAFFDVSLRRLHAPWLMRDMDGAVDITLDALERGKKILVYGDYDVDGVTATALVVDALRGLGGAVDYYIPHRVDEGYGLHAPVLHKARENGVQLVITVDCGISAAAAVEEAGRSGGPEIIITDHHEPPPVLPGAAAVLNPKREDCAYPYRDLAGVGVAFKFVQALLEKAGRRDWEQYLDLVCLGTVADIVPLHGENRILVKNGLPRLAETARPGLKALCRASGIKGETLGTWEVAFILAPRLNAAGRLGDAGLAVQLLLTGDPGAAWDMAQELNRANQERQQMEAIVFAEALGMLEGDTALAGGKVLVLASPHWHPGVIGIVASRLVERYYKPVLLVACEGDRGKGSARSVKGFNIYRALEYCADCLDGYGGHAMAGGFTLAADRVDELRVKINEYAGRYLSEQDQVPVLELDALVSLSEINRELVSEIEQLAPHGHGNPDPLLGLRRAKLLHCREVGKNNAHLKMLLGDRQATLDGIGFNLGQLAGELAAGKEVDVAFTPSVNSWMGRESIQAKVKDIQEKPAESDDAACYPPARDEYLQRAGDLIFVPETLAIMTREYLTARGRPVPPEMHMLAATVPNPHPAGDAPACPPSAGESKESRLVRLTPSRSCTLLLVNCSRHTLQLARYISDYNPYFAGRVRYWHGFMPADRVREDVHNINNGAVKLVVATISCLPEEPSPAALFDRVALAWPPVTAADWQRLQRVAGEVEVWYTERERQDVLGHLDDVAPERDVLARYYTLLRSAAPSGAGGCRAAALLERVNRDLRGPLTLVSLAVAAAVFADLGLLHYSWEGSMLKYKFLSGRSEKKDLAWSPTFTWGQEVKSQILHWMNGARK